MSLAISYELEGNGTASVTFADDHREFIFRICNLHDSLLDLVKLALIIKGVQPGAAKTVQAVFVIDPGEIHFVVSVVNGAASYELRKFDEWASLEQATESGYTTLLKGETMADDICQQITNVLVKIHQNIGPEEYLVLWQGHKFPLAEYQELIGERKDDHHEWLDRGGLLWNICWSVVGYLIFAVTLSISMSTGIMGFIEMLGFVSFLSFFAVMTVAMFTPTHRLSRFKYETYMVRRDYYCSQNLGFPFCREVPFWKLNLFGRLLRILYLITAVMWPILINVSYWMT